VENLVVVPISFVSEHIETLEEIDIQYREIARKAGINNFQRVRALDTTPAFIRALADLVQRVLAGPELTLDQAAALPIKVKLYPQQQWAWGWNSSSEAWNGRMAMPGFSALLLELWCYLAPLKKLLRLNGPAPQGPRRTHGLRGISSAICLNFLKPCKQSTAQHLIMPEFLPYCHLMSFGPASLLGVERFDSQPPLELIPGDSSEKKDQLIVSVYRQVLGNAYVMETERQLIAESQFKLGELSLREFIRIIAKSDLYRSRFFESCPRYRYIELAFRHLLGRAPTCFDEMRAHSERLDSEGYETDIDSFIDSEEYQDTFGEWTVPYQRGWKTESCKTLQEFTWSFQLLRGASSSSLKGNLSGKSARLGGNAYLNRAIPVVPPSSNETQGWSFRPSVNLQDGQTRLGVGAGEEGRIFRVEVTSYRANTIRPISRYKKSNRTYFVPFNKLSDIYKQIHREGGVIASITPN
jgi:phycoerythrin-associated linker protein